MKHVLVVTAYFPPAAFIGSQRPLKLVRDIGPFGWRASVLTVAEKCSGLIDKNSASKIPNDVEVVRVPCWSLWNHSQWWQSVRGKARRSAAMANRFIARRTWNLLPTDQHWPWSIAAVNAGVELVRRNKSEVIWATSPSLSALTLARRISQETDVPFVTDFRDVRSAPNAGSPRNARNAFKNEARVLRFASAITYVAPEQISVLRRNHPEIVPRLPSELVYNWFDVTECGDKRAWRFDDPTILHGGILYGGARRMDGFMEALAIVRRTDSEFARRLRFLQLGGMSSDHDYLNALARRFDVGAAVDVRASVPHDEFARACKGATVLILVVGREQGIHRHSGAIPGKLYTYFAAQRPVLVIGPDGCEAGRMVCELNRGVFVPDDQPNQIADALTGIADARDDEGAFDLSIASLAPYSAEATLRSLTALFDQVCSSSCNTKMVQPRSQRQSS